MLELIKETLGELAWGVLAIIVFLWWIGGPGMTAFIWSDGDRGFALQFLAAWAAVTALCLAASRLIRRARRS
ncbi:hypothetical protein ACWCQZ_06770 [Streptomyces sp. NPDC002285]|uniref:hypothetical protein n=1 Tax=Streptomyces sp. NPDC056468 TaxID=3345830 RepID=UPI0036A46552